MRYVLLTIVLLNLMGFKAKERGILTLHLENIRSTKGNILVGIYKDQESWSKRTPFLEYTFSKTNMSEGRLTLTLTNMEPGLYGLALLDDANGNEIVHMGMIFPKEGFGFSDYYHGSFLPPRFQDFTFNFPEKQDVNVTFRYLNKGS